MNTSLVPALGPRLARLFDDDWFPQLLGSGWRSLEPQIRVEEQIDGDTLIIRAEAPGIDPERDVDLSVTDQTLHLRVERRQEQTEREDGSYRSEFRYGSFRRTIPLPAGISAENVTATYRDGILEVRLPVPQASTPAPTKVPVTRGS